MAIEIDMNVVEALTRRVEALERQKRQLSRGLLCVVMLVAGVAAAAQVTPSRPTTVAGDRFTLVDGQNRTRAALERVPAGGPLGEDPVLTFFDQQGRPRIRFGIAARGPILEVIEPGGKTRDYFGPWGVRPATD
jgi:hypothetical protein